MKIKRLSLVFCIPLILLALERFCHAQTDGFRISTIRLASDCETKTPPPPFLTTLFAKPLRYIGRGGQCYVFTTQEEEYVVKFLKKNNNDPDFWLTLCPFPGKWEQKRQQMLAKKQRKKEGEYASYALAQTHLSTETGLVYFHLQKQFSSALTLSVIDKIGVSHPIEIDNYQFYIQKKGSPLYPGIQAMLEAGEMPKAQTVIAEIVSFLFYRAAQGIHDGDDGIWRNFALDNAHPFQIDIGQLSQTSSLSTKEKQKEDVRFFLKDFRQWLEKTSPPLALYLEKCLDEAHEKTL